MGRKKKDNSIGNSIIKDRFHGRMNKTSDSFLHTSELQDGTEWGRLNLQSVTEQSHLEDFLATAEMAATDFTAERQNIQIVGSTQHAGLPSAEQITKTKAAEDENRKFLQIPRRPKWDEMTTAEELDLSERTAFLDWRRQLAALQENENLTLTPFERNLDFWRQLWRVIERSDVVVQIVDARNPLLFRCEDLERYVREVGADKVNVVLINKADLLTQQQRETWATYLDSVGLTAVFWSAVEETARCKREQEEEEERLRAEEETMEINSEDDSDYDEESNEEESDEEGEDEINEQPATGVEQLEHRLRENVKDAGSEKKSSSKPEASNQITVNDGAVVGTTAQTLVECVIERMDSVTTNDVRTMDVMTRDSVDTQEGCFTQCGNIAGLRTADDDCMQKKGNNPNLLTGDELISFLSCLHKGPTYTDGVTTLGLVGYPNVGKSSSINAILQAKKVPVSATPGRTKHFQTLFVDKDVLLCDCPGLVMPTFVSTKAEMVVSGILPIDQMRDHIPPTTLVCQYIERSVLEATYGIILPLPGEGEHENRPPTAEEMLASYGYMRGFMTHKGVPDYPRAARHILKDYMNGKLLYAHPPPGVSEMDFGSAAPPQKVVKVSLADHTGRTRKVTQYANSVDGQFFAKTDVKIGAKGVKAKMGQAEGLGSKKHFKKGKKEKLRRIHGYADN